MTSPKFSRWVMLAVMAGVVAGCSSAPPAPEGVHDRKNRAADYLKFGQQAFLEAKYDQALSFYLVAVDLDTAVDDELGMAASWNSVATVQLAQGKTDAARDSLVLASTYAALAKDPTLSLQVAVNLVKEDLDTSNLAGARVRLTALTPFPDTLEGAALYHLLGSLDKAEDHLPEAIEAFDRAGSINQRLGLKEEWASNRFMKATVLSKQGKVDAAVAEVQAALALDRTMENTMGIGQDWRALGTLALKVGNLEGAFDAWVRATRLFQAAGLADQAKKTIALLLPVTVSLGRSEETARYQALLDRLNAAP